MRLRTTVVAMLACCVALFIPGSALAASSPTQDAYSGVAGQQQGGGEPQSTTEAGTEATQASSEPAAEESSGTLPFTGFEMAAIAIVAVALLAAGVFLYRRSRHAAQPQA